MGSISPAAKRGVARGKVVHDALSQLKPVTGRSMVLPLVTFCAAALPVLYLLFLVHRYAVPIPALDDWEMAPLVVKAHRGGLTFFDLFEQQQESRTFFPKLIFILFSFGRHWDVRVEMMLSIFFCCLTSLGIYFLLKKSALSGVAAAAVFILVVLLIFSPVQEELWLLASGFPSFIPALCIVAGLVVIRTNVSVAAKFSLCLVLAFFSSFSLANGVLAWGLTFPVLFLTQRNPAWKGWLGSWLTAGVICAAIYFWKFRPQDELPQFAPPESPPVYLQYLCAFLGSGLARVGNEHPLAVASFVGALLLLGYLAVLTHVIFCFRDAEHRARVLPWLALGMYSIGSGCLAAMGRIGWGVSQALESRYVTFSLYLTVAMIALIAILAERLSKVHRSAGARLTFFTAVIFFGASYLTLELLCAAASVPLFRVRSAALHLGHGAILFNQVLDTSETIKLVNFPRPHFVRQNADALDRLHLLKTPLIRTKEIQALRHSDNEDPSAVGWFDGLAPSGQDLATAWGWAALVGRGRPADCVVLAYSNKRGEWIAFALSNAVVSRPDVAKVLESPEQLWTGWQATFHRGAVPEGAKISAWAVDAKDGKLYRLKENAQVPKL